jgi:hypothetical protein
MEKECGKRRLHMDFNDDWTRLAELMTKHGAGEKAILENWRICLDGLVKPPDKMRFFVEDYSKYAGYRIEQQRRELEATYPKDGKLADPILEAMAKAAPRKPPLPSQPPGSEGMAAYSWEEVSSLKDAAPERVIATYKLKKAFNATVRCADTCATPTD